ncbi:MAG: hypothetical protein M1838_002205 [Thelocarpon superellum]|nr:MAG: hypothetical protein M1838_002205 [Thelocarpon superellum]
MAEEEASGAPTPKAGPTFSTAERIEQLNGIDKDLTSLLASASEALKALTASPHAAGTLESHKDAFASATATYFRLLSSVDVRLRRQIHALEEAAIIGSGKEAATLGDASVAEVAAGGRAGAGGEKKALEKTGGAGVAAAPGTSPMGTGSLDVGWLNSRGNVVGDEMWALLWADARAFLDRLETQDQGQDRADSEHRDDMEQE